MTDSWNPPTGPPNGAPVHPNDARREIDDAVAAAQADDQRIRQHLAEVAAARVRAAATLEAASAQVAEARTLAKRALAKANDSARAGQRADAAKWNAAAQVFAKRLVDARREADEAERVLAAAGTQHEWVRTALARNVGRLQAVAAARLPMIPGRKAVRWQRLVDDTVAALALPVDDLVARAEADARAALAAAADEDPELVVAEDDLEDELDVAGTDAVLDELRTELGLLAVAPVEAPAVVAGDAADPPPRDIPTDLATAEATAEPPSGAAAAGTTSTATSRSAEHATGARR